MRFSGVDTIFQSLRMTTKDMFAAFDGLRAVKVRNVPISRGSLPHEKLPLLSRHLESVAVMRVRAIAAFMELVSTDPDFGSGFTWHVFWIWCLTSLDFLRSPYGSLYICMTSCFLRCFNMVWPGLFSTKQGPVCICQSYSSARENFWRSIYRLWHLPQFLLWLLVPLVNRNSRHEAVKWTSNKRLVHSMYSTVCGKSDIFVMLRLSSYARMLNSDFQTKALSLKWVDSVSCTFDLLLRITLR